MIYAIGSVILLFVLMFQIKGVLTQIRDEQRKLFSDLVNNFKLKD